MSAAIETLKAARERVVAGIASASRSMSAAQRDLALADASFRENTATLAELDAAIALLEPQEGEPQ